MAGEGRLTEANAAPAAQGHMTEHSHGVMATGRHRQYSIVVLALTTLVAVGEVIGAVITGSLVLFADAAHMAADAAGLGLSLFAAFVAAWPPTERRTFGYARAEILAAMANAVLLLAMAGFILYEAIQRLVSPERP